LSVFLAASAAVLVAAWAMAPAKTQQIESRGVARSTPPAAAAAPAAESTVAPRVTIEQQLVHADVTTEAARAARPQSGVKRAATAPPRKEGFFTRARRAIFGGGRHKPSPFPTAQ
jgi:hypothetical protein